MRAEKSIEGHIPHTAEGSVLRNLPFGFLAYLGAGVSLAICYVEVFVAKSAAVFGHASIPVNPHLQAVLMWSFGLVAVVGLALDRKAHDRILPLAVGASGLVIMIGDLYIHHDSRILIFSFILLLVGAFLNQYFMLDTLNRTVQLQARELEDLTNSLETRVEKQVSEIEGLTRLKRFLAPEIADLITSEGNESLLDSHRRYIAVLFCDIRNFTALSDSAEPEDVINILQNYHEHLGRLVAEHHGTIGYRAGDGLMVFFNDPIPCDEPVRKAVDLAMDMRDMFNKLRQGWEKLDFQLGFGVGVASGFATLGIVGFEGCHDYTAIGNVVNLASRLCDQAEDGQILINHRAFVDVEAQVHTEAIGTLTLRGVTKPVQAYSVVAHADGDVIPISARAN